MKIAQLILIIGLCLLAVVARAEIYKWVDENGKVHYGDKPNESAKEITVDTSRKGHVNTGEFREEKRRKLVDAMSEDRIRESEAKEKQRKKKQKQKANCARAKDKLRRMVNAGSLYDLDKDGNRVTLSKDERKKSTEQFRKQLEQYCK